MKKRYYKKLMRDFTQEILDRFDEELEQEIRVDQTRKVLETIADMFQNGGCSYRKLLENLNLSEYYVDLLAGMAVTNGICDYETLKEGGQIDNEY